LIVSGYVTRIPPNQQVLVNVLFFITEKMCSRAEGNAFVGQIWPESRSIENLV